MKNRLFFVVFLSAMSFGFSALSHAGIFDDVIDPISDIVDPINDAIDTVTNLFSSTKKVANSVVVKIDKNIIANTTGRCSVVEANNGIDESETVNVVDKCGHSVRKLKDVFEDVGGEIVEQGQEVENHLEEIAKDEWDGLTKPFADSVKELISYFGGSVFDTLKGTSTDLLNAMSDVKSTLADASFPSGDLISGSNVDVSYTFDLGASQFDLLVSGTVKNKITVSGQDFVGVDGMLVVKLTSNSAVGYNPQVYAQLEYVNPIIKVEDDRITGLMVIQPEGEIKLTAAVLPLQFTANLDKLKTLPGLNNIHALQQAARAVRIDADIGTVEISVPLTNQSNSRFNFDLSVSGGIDAVAKISGNWRVTIAERVTWTRKIALDIPALQLPLESVPAGLISELESDSEPSYAEQIVSYTFNEDEGSEIIEDKSGFGNDARIVGGVILKDGAAYFNGIDGYIDLPDDLMATMDAITVYAEVYINEEQETPYFIYGLGNSKGDWGNGYLFTTGDIYRSAMSSCNWTCEQNTSEKHFNVPRKSWQKIVYTVNGDVATLYLNGDKVAINKGITLKPSDIGDGRTTANYIGRSLYSGDKYLNGAVSNFQIWSGALTHAEIVEKFGNSTDKNSAEDQPDTTAAWDNIHCGCEMAPEWLHCNGSNGFGNNTVNQ